MPVPSRALPSSWGSAKRNRGANVLQLGLEIVSPPGWKKRKSRGGRKAIGFNAQIACLSGQANQFRINPSGQ